MVTFCVASSLRSATGRVIAHKLPIYMALECEHAPWLRRTGDAARRGPLHSSVVAYVLVRKFGLGVPHYRLEQH
jgi:hypothetical protein